MSAQATYHHIILVNMNKVQQVNIQILQGGPVADLRQGGRYFNLFYSSSQNATVNKIIKIGPHLPKLSQMTVWVLLFNSH